MAVFPIRKKFTTRPSNTFERRPEPYLKIFRLKKGLKGEIIVQGKLNWSKVQDTVMDKGSRNNLGPLNIEFT